MESYIFYCYKDWLRERNGSLLKQISKLTVWAIVLLSLLFIALVFLIVILFVSFKDKTVIDLAYIPMVADILLSVIISIYTENYQIKHSERDLNAYRAYCVDLNKMLFKKGISNNFIPNLIDKFNETNNGIEEKIGQKREYVNKFMEMLLIPISVIILGALLDKGASAEETLGYGLSGILIIIIVYGLIIFSSFLYNTIMRIPQSKYRQFVIDLQSIIDFRECEKGLEKDDTDTSSPIKDTSENDNPHLQSIN